VVFDLVELSRLEPEAQDAAIDRIEQALRRRPVDTETMAELRLLADQMNWAATERLKFN
jgi:hypothetical protein